MMRPEDRFTQLLRESWTQALREHAISSDKYPTDYSDAAAEEYIRSASLPATFLASWHRQLGKALQPWTQNYSDWLPENERRDFLASFSEGGEGVIKALATYTEFKAYVNATPRTWGVAK